MGLFPKEHEVVKCMQSEGKKKPVSRQCDTDFLLATNKNAKNSLLKALN